MDQLELFPGDPLLAAVIQSPDDDAPRLAYADAVEAEGDCDRAAFIRVQLALARLSMSDPRRPDLVAQERELLAQYAERWAEPFAPFATVWDYRRGFVEWVETCLERPADAIRELFALAPIRHVRD